MKNLILKLIASITRKISIPGIQRVLALIYSPNNRSLDHFSTVVPYDGKMINVDTKSFIEWVVFFRGLYEPEVTAFINSVLRPDFVVMDIGANIGLHTISMSKAKSVISFEPHPIISDRLRKNISLNKLQNVVVKQIALSDKSGEMKLFSMRESDSNQGVSSFYNFNPEIFSENFIVPVKTLDEVAQDLNRLDFIKIDTEGNDFKVLLGGRRTIEKFRPILIFEWSREHWNAAGHSLKEVIDFFALINYELGILDRNFHKNNSIKPISEIGDFNEIIARPIR